jgi:hypothetical protein
MNELENIKIESVQVARFCPKDKIVLRIRQIGQVSFEQWKQIRLQVSEWAGVSIDNVLICDQSLEMEIVRDGTNS